MNSNPRLRDQSIFHTRTSYVAPPTNIYIQKNPTSPSPTITTLPPLVQYLHTPPPHTPPPTQSSSLSLPPPPSLHPIHFLSPHSPSSLSSKLQWPPQPPLHSLNSLHQAFTLTTTHHHNPLSPRRLSLNLSSSSSSSSLTSTITFSLLTPTNKLHRFIILLLRRACRHLAAADYRKGRRRNRRLSIALAGDSAKKRGYVFFCRASKFIDPSDLRAIDSLWLAHSDGKFGYSVQKRVWEKKARRDFTRFFIRVGWMKKLDTEVEQWNYRSFPTEFTWELRDDTPEGHLPLTNALRGTQLLASIFTHPAFAEEGEEEEGEESDGEEMKKEKPKLMGGNRTLKTDYSF
ncbi:tetrapyrrole-binding protein, chloroplastic [Asparagus officinalis]|uniref:tetrapyrrole-binding protein, chloroplastic n=1 Tax=Asparagus officinalis TaxID=4686 RepID=UPI00098E7771|nr:tetrapyrrole-binding protein, chloroplastic [Asparagus officinalis]